MDRNLFDDLRTDKIAELATFDPDVLMAKLKPVRFLLTANYCVGCYISCPRVKIAEGSIYKLQESISCLPPSAPRKVIMAFKSETQF
jgi:hypothetical protein